MPYALHYFYFFITCWKFNINLLQSLGAARIKRLSCTRVYKSHRHWGECEWVSEWGRELPPASCKLFMPGAHPFSWCVARENQCAILNAPWAILPLFLWKGLTIQIFTGSQSLWSFFFFTSYIQSPQIFYGQVRWPYEKVSLFSNMKLSRNNTSGCISSCWRFYFVVLLIFS